MEASLYSKSFYDEHTKGAILSAGIILPLVLDLFHPASIVDVGCGIGTWSSVVRQLGVEHCLGIDGPWVQTEQLLIPRDSFITHDLETPITIDPADLCICLEVAEHLKEGKLLIESLCSTSSVVLFSAAAPHQMGVYHINEQYPRYWADLFRTHGFYPVDVIRYRVWDNDDVCWWYRQNVLLFISRELLSLRRDLPIADPEFLYKPHPAGWCKLPEDSVEEL